MSGNGLELSSIVAITRAIISSLDPDDVLETLVKKARALDGVSACAVFEYDEELSSLKIRRGSGLSKSYVRSLVIPVGALAVGRAFKSKDVQVVGDIVADPSYGPYLRRLLRQELKAIVAAPLVAQDKLLGILAIYFDHPVSPEDYDTDSICTLSALAACVLYNALLFQRQLGATRQLEVLYRQLSAQSDLVNRSLQIHEWLVNTVLTRDGLEAVARTLAELAQSTVVVEDLHLNVLCISRVKPALGMIHTESPDAALIQFGEDARVRKHIAQARSTRRPELLPSIREIGLTTARIIAPVVVGDDLLGFVSVLLPTDEVRPLDFVLAEQGAVAVGLEMMKRKVAFEVEQKLRGDFLHSLLAGQLDQIDDAGAAVGGGKFDLRALQGVIIVRLDKPEGANEAEFGQSRQVITNSHLQVSYVIERPVLQLFPKAVTIVTNEGVVVLLGSDETVSDTMVRRLAGQIVSTAALDLAPATVSVGVGGCCKHPRDLRRSFDEATQALEVAAILQKRNTVISFADLGIYGILLRQSNPNELREFARRYIEPLEAYDHAHGSDLLQTLKMYVRHRYRLDDTARELYVHPNTVKYRLQKIHELTGITAADSEGLMTLQFALRVHELLR